jgi:hypothetical protein
MPCDDDASFLAMTKEAGMFDVTCSIVPSGGAFAVTITAQASPATATISGTFTPRSRDANGTPNADTTPIPNITMDLLDTNMHLRGTNCFAEYVLDDGGHPGAPLPSVADTYASGSIFVSVFCEDPTSLLEAQEPGFAGCASNATFILQGCATQ